MLKALFNRIAWMLGQRRRYGKWPRCPFKPCNGFATHTWWGYQGDDLRDIDACRRHHNNRKDVEHYREKVRT